MLVKNLFDIITFKKKYFKEKSFDIIGNFSCKTEQNIIYKAYRELLNLKENSQKIQNFFEYYAIEVEKCIPEFAGLGGGSSNAAAFLHLTNKTLSLNLRKNSLLEISNKIGADVAFFTSLYESANVNGIGEKVEKFIENSLALKTFTPPIKCETPKIYKKFRKELNKNYDKIVKNNRLLSKKLESLKSDEILENFNMENLNDLYNPAVSLYPDLKNYKKEGYFFSGSGSSFFRRENG